MYKSYFSTVGLTVSNLNETVWTNRPCKTGTYWTHSPKEDFTFKAERNSTHIHHRLWNWRYMSMSSYGWTSCFKAVNSDQAHTHTHTHIPTFLIQCLWLTQPPEGKTSQHVVLPQTVPMVLQHKAVFCSYYTDPSFWNRMHDLQWSTFGSVTFILWNA